jgi:hypothetical protein
MRNPEHFRTEINVYLAYALENPLICQNMSTSSRINIEKDMQRIFCRSQIHQKEPQPC